MAFGHELLQGILISRPQQGFALPASFGKQATLSQAGLAALRGVASTPPTTISFKEMIDQDPDITLHELQGATQKALGVHIPRSSLSRVLLAMGLTFKKRRSSPPNDPSQG